jgi:hypothetical protein
LGFGTSYPLRQGLTASLFVNVMELVGDVLANFREIMFIDVYLCEHSILL